MEENKNITEEIPQEQPIDTERIDKPDSFIEPVTEAGQQTINPNLQTENMEVHKHPHHVTYKKKWGEYLLEFFMLFLAVFLGFLVENYREKATDREKEKQAIESLVKCLASDTVQLNVIINSNFKVMNHLDSVAFFKNADLSNEEIKKRFLLHGMIGFNEDWYFKTNDAALQQLKSSGILRLIRKQNISDSIFKYELKNKTTISQEMDTYYLWKKSLDDFMNAVDYTYFRDTNAIKYFYKENYFQFEIIKPVAFPITTDKEKLNKVFGNAAQLAASEEFYGINMKDQLAYCIVLIDFLKSEYQFENE